MNLVIGDETPPGKVIIFVKNPFTEFRAIAGLNRQMWYYSSGSVCFKKRKLLISLTN